MKNETLGAEQASIVRSINEILGYNVEDHVDVRFEAIPEGQDIRGRLVFEDGMGHERLKVISNATLPLGVAAGDFERQGSYKRFILKGNMAVFARGMEQAVAARSPQTAHPQP